MHRIFLTLMVVGNIANVAAFAMGWIIGDPKAIDPVVQSNVSTHLTIAIAAIVAGMLLHAITLTYFMGTGRWLEETSRAYKLGPDFHAGNQKLKYRFIPGMVACIIMLLVTGAFGAAADPASPIGFTGFLGLPASTIHFGIATITILLNLMVNITEYKAINSNGTIVNNVLAEVRRIRIEKGLPV
ncbi:hypothetical protein OAH18_01630 [bacterium]|nr:hypothetical protein [bacterium]